MDSLKYKCDARTKTFLMLWLGFGFNLMAETEWSQIDWKEVEIRVFKLQKRIYRASLSGDVAKVHKLQRLLLKSWCAKLLAVRRISQDNQGKNTAGIDGIKSLSPKQRLSLAENLTLTGKGESLRRVWIPKPGRKEKRGLGIPVMEDRARQALLKLALEPEWEAKFEPNSYGFRPGRSCHDAEQAIFSSIRCKSKWVLDADISKCFDRINHDVLLQKLNTTPIMARQIRAWLKSGVLDRGEWFPTNEGTPQGGVISPLLANIALHGLEEYIKQWAETWKGRKKNNRNSISLIRSVLDSMKGKSQEVIIDKLNPIIRGWCNYHKTVCSKETFNDIDDLVYNKLRRWIKRRHPNKTLKWCEERYFHLTKENKLNGDKREDRWVFSTPSDIPNSPVAGKHELRKHAWTPIERHIKIEGTRTPYDGAWRYWSKRRGEYPGIYKRVATLVKRQKGKCTRCGLYFKDGDVEEVDHIIPKAEGGRDDYKNLQLLHRHCHHQKTVEDRQRQMDNQGQKKTQKKTKKNRKSETRQGSSVNTA